MGKAHRDTVKADENSLSQPADGAGVESTPAWEKIENGRYMPRRIRGSYRGRELG
jgi:hypothetical protein